jgi:hypothetical protein
MNSVRCKMCGMWVPLLNENEQIVGIDCTELDCEAKIKPQEDNYVDE